MYPWYIMILHIGLKYFYKYTYLMKLYLTLILILLLIIGGSNGIRLIYFAMYTFFLCFIYFPQIMGFFKLTLLTKIGESSYFLYLIHESVGVFLIYLFGKYFLPNSFIWPIFLMIFFIIVSYYFTILVDKKINKWLRNKLHI